MKKVYKVKNNLVVEKKVVKDSYILQDNEYEGEMIHPLGTSHKTGNLPKAVKDKRIKDDRIDELRTLISDMKLLDMDCTAEQGELKTLLGL